MIEHIAIVFFSSSESAVMKIAASDSSWRICEQESYVDNVWRNFFAMLDMNAQRLLQNLLEWL